MRLRRYKMLERRPDSTPFEGTANELYQAIRGQYLRMKQGSHVGFGL